MRARKRRQIFRGIGQLHRMALLRREIDNDLIEQKIPLRHATESPAFMQAIGPGFELIELLGLAGGYFRRLDELLQFSIHRDAQGKANRDVGERKLVSCLRCTA